MPEYIKELIQWQIVDGAIGVSCCLLVMIVALSAWRLLWIASRKWSEIDGGAPMYASRVITSVVLLFAISISSTNMLDYVRSATKAYVAPRVVIVEKIAELAKGVKK